MHARRLSGAQATASCGPTSTARTRPRVLPLAGGLLVNLRGVNLNPGADPEDMVSVRMWIDAERLISMRAPD